MTADPGFNRERLTTFGIVLPGSSYPKGEDKVAFFTRLADRLKEVPGVIGVAEMTGLPPNRPVNAIPCVCAAPPGILSITDLPPILPCGPDPD